VRRWPEDVRALGMLASLHARLGNAPSAAKFFREALAQRPDSVIDLNNFAWFLATKSDASPAERAEAVFLARRAVEIEPGSHLHRGTLAVALLANGHPESAREEGNRALALAREAGDQDSVQQLQFKLRGVEAAP